MHVHVLHMYHNDGYMIYEQAHVHIHVQCTRKCTLYMHSCKAQYSYKTNIINLSYHLHVHNAGTQQWQIHTYMYIVHVHVAMCTCSTSHIYMYMHTYTCTWSSWEHSGTVRILNPYRLSVCMRMFHQETSELVIKSRTRTSSVIHNLKKWNEITRKVFSEAKSITKWKPNIHTYTCTCTCTYMHALHVKTIGTSKHHNKYRRSKCR